MNWKVFDTMLENSFIEHLRSPGSGIYTYIAKSKDGKAYKIGKTRNPKQREAVLRNEKTYKQFGLTITYLFEGWLELFLHDALYQAGAKEALPHSEKHRTREIFYLHPNSIRRVIRKCGFRPIENFDL